MTNRARSTLAATTTLPTRGAPPDDTAARRRLLARLLSNDPLTLAERASLGLSVSRDELASTIEHELATSDVFPPTASGRTQVRVSATGVYLVHSRLNRRRDLEPCPSVREAVERFLDIEIGPSCGGVRVRSARAEPRGVTARG